MSRGTHVPHWGSVGIFDPQNTAGTFPFANLSAFVKAISAAAREISARNLSLRLTVPRTGDDIQRLSETLNGMIAILDEAFKRIGDFTANAAHELRSPIAVMLTTSELALRSGGAGADLRQAREDIRAEAVRTAALVEDLMALTRADAGHTEVSRPLDLGEVVGEVCRCGEPLARAKQVNVDGRIPAGVAVTGDRNALSRMFVIFLDNEVRYTPEGGKIHVALDRANSSAVCTIADTGTGISAEDQPHVFERFYRADHARSSLHRRGPPRPN